VHTFACVNKTKHEILLGLMLSVMGHETRKIKAKHYASEGKELAT